MNHADLVAWLLKVAIDQALMWDDTTIDPTGQTIITDVFESLGLVEFCMMIEEEFSIALIDEIDVKNQHDFNGVASWLLQEYPRVSSS